MFVCVNARTQYKQLDRNLFTDTNILQVELVFQHSTSNFRYFKLGF